LNLFQNKKIFIASLSFGKDSMAMVDLLLRHDKPLDYIIFNDTMYEYADKIKKYIKDRYGKDIVITKPKATFEQWAFGLSTRGKHEGMVRGIPLLHTVDGQCFWRRESKIKPYDLWIKENIGKDSYIKYIGFTTDEIEKRRLKEENIIYPLVEYFDMCEKDCFEYLRERELENPLYRYFDRTGCMMCPAQSDYAWFMIFSHFKETWEWMRDIENKLQDLLKRGYEVINPFWFSKHRTMNDMELLFKSIEAKELDTSYLKDCMCVV
jgi:3'-phosphoadenosine 5'-phosphosulfate sulfotransferase (PAPS reductase)/FAD synthetase